MISRQPIQVLALVACIALLAPAPAESSTDGYQLLQQAYEDFRSGNTDASRVAARKALTTGLSNDDSNLIGGALTALCRLALRDNDASAISELTTEMEKVALRAGEPRWHVYATHMRAELARMNGRLDEADALYVESLNLATRIGLVGMVAAENFNRSFISVARGDLDSAREQVVEHFRVSALSNDGSPGAYGLIALANLLAARDQFEQAAVVVFATRRIFDEQGIVPDPADATPLQNTEALIAERLSKEALANAQELARDMSVPGLIDKYL